MVVNSTNLDAYFNEPVDVVTSQTLTNYAVDFGIGNPSAAVRDAVDSSLVHLTFGTPFVNGQPALLVLTSSRLPSEFFTNQAQPDPNVVTAHLVNASLKSANDPKLEIIASARAPSGSPPPLGDKLFQ